MWPRISGAVYGPGGSKDPYAYAMTNLVHRLLTPQKIQIKLWDPGKKRWPYGEKKEGKIPARKVHMQKKVPH